MSFTVGKQKHLGQRWVTFERNTRNRNAVEPLVSDSDPVHVPEGTGSY